MLAEEIELRRHKERVAAQRRALPEGPLAPPYRFLDAEGRELGLRELFGPHDTLLSIAKARRLLGYEPQHSWRDGHADR